MECGHDALSRGEGHFFVAMATTEMMISCTHIGVQSVFLWYVWLCIDCIPMQSMHSIPIYVMVLLPKWAPNVLCYDGVCVQGLRRPERDEHS